MNVTGRGLEPAGRFRRAWCELTGGHDRKIMKAHYKDSMVSNVRFVCTRCGSGTRWYSLIDLAMPDRAALSARSLEVG